MTARIQIILIVCIILGNKVEAQQYIDSLETKFILVNNEEKLRILDELIPYYFRNERFQALKSAEKMHSLAMQVGNKEFEIKAQRYLGLSDSQLKSDHETALQKCYQAENNAKSNGFIEELILTKLAIADIYHQLGNNTKALEYQLDAYHLSDSMKFTHLHSIILNNEARSYIQLEDHEKAELCLKNSLKNAKIYDQEEIIAETNLMFGDLYSEVFNHEMALQHYQTAHEVFIKLHKDIHVAIALFKIGNSYFSLDMVDESFQNHLNALAIRNRIKDRTGLAESYNEIGHICIENGEYIRAINNLKLGLANSELINSNILMQHSFDFLSLAYMGIEDYKNAAIYKNKYSSISELIYSEYSERRIQELNTQNEIARRELQIMNLKEIRDQTDKQLAASKKFNFTLVLLLVVTAISVFFFVRSYREKRRINKELQATNDKVVKQNEELSELNSTKDKFFSIIGHDLKGPLNSLTAFSQLLINHTASLSEEEIRTVARDLDKSLKNLYELLENLLGWARSQTGKLEFVAENIRISEVIKENIRLLSKAALNKKIKIEMMVDEHLEIHADQNSIKTVIRNLLSNAIKFTPEGGVISIYVDEWKDNVEIGIHDTGVGMSKEVQEKIFDISAKHTSLGTNKEKGTGLGLILCKEFIERNGGLLTVESEVNTGSTFKFTLPKLAHSKSAQLEEVNEG